jgi:hypothetical protein
MKAVIACMCSERLSTARLDGKVLINWQLMVLDQRRYGRQLSEHARLYGGDGHAGEQIGRGRRCGETGTPVGYYVLLGVCIHDD